MMLKLEMDFLSVCHINLLLDEIIDLHMSLMPQILVWRMHKSRQTACFSVRDVALSCRYLANDHFGDTQRNCLFWGFYITCFILSYFASSVLVTNLSSVLWYEFWLLLTSSFQFPSFQQQGEDSYGRCSPSSSGTP